VTTSIADPATEASGSEDFATEETGTEDSGSEDSGSETGEAEPTETRAAPRPETDEAKRDQIDREQANHDESECDKPESYRAEREKAERERAEREEAERRNEADRRARPTSPFAALSGWQRRRQGRRSQDREIYVDAFTRRDAALIVVIFALNLLDAGFTLLILEQGGSEANPFMAVLLELGDAAFLWQKCFVVGLWLLFLIVHKNFRFARMGLWTLFVLYSGLFGYHLVLQALVARGI